MITIIVIVIRPKYYDSISNIKNMVEHCSVYRILNHVTKEININITSKHIEIRKLDVTTATPRLFNYNDTNIGTYYFKFYL